MSFITGTHIGRRPMLRGLGATVALPVYVVIAGVEPFRPMCLFGVAAAALVIYTHRGNIARMRAGTEPKASRSSLISALRVIAQPLR